MGETKRETRQLVEDFRRFLQIWCLICKVSGSGHVRPRQATEICNFGAPSPLEALHWIFCFFSRFSVQFGKTSPPKSGESSEKSSGENRVKSCHVCGCHGFFGPEWFGATEHTAENCRKPQETAENRRKQFRPLSPI